MTWPCNDQCVLGLALATIPQLLLAYLPTYYGICCGEAHAKMAWKRSSSTFFVYIPTLNFGCWTGRLAKKFFFSLPTFFYSFFFPLIPRRKDADSLYKVAWVWEFQQNYARYHYRKVGSTINTSRLNRSTWYHLQLRCVACPSWHLRLTWGRGNRGKGEFRVVPYCHQYCFGSLFDLNTYKDG